MPDETYTNGVHYRRFTRLNRALHFLMILSFMLLALTGMTLKFSYTGWAAFISRVFGGFETAGYIHRVAAVVMVGIFATHVVDLFRIRRKHYGGSWRALLTGPDTMLPTKRDFREFVGADPAGPARCGQELVVDVPVRLVAEAAGA